MTQVILAHFDHFIIGNNVELIICSCLNNTFINYGTLTKINFG